LESESNKECQSRFAIEDAYISAYRFGVQFAVKSMRKQGLSPMEILKIISTEIVISESHTRSSDEGKPQVTRVHGKITFSNDLRVMVESVRNPVQKKRFKITRVNFGGETISKTSHTL
jgi:hypothetical protein